MIRFVFFQSVFDAPMSIQKYFNVGEFYKMILDKNAFYQSIYSGNLTF